jgi:hypothetical protein
VTVEVLAEHPLVKFREDVKLAPTLGLALGWLSWGTVAVGVVAGFLLGGLAGLGGMLALWPVAHGAAAVRTLAGRRCAAGRPRRRRVAGWFQASPLGAR